MAIRDNTYLDKIMGGVQGDPLTNISNEFARSGTGIDQGFINQYNLGQRYDSMFDNEDFKEIPGFNFIDAPTSLKSRLTNREFFNNPAVQNPLEKIGSGVTSVIDKTKSGIGKAFDLGKAAFGGIASLVTGIPGIGLLLNAFGPMSPEEKAMRDFYGSEFGLTDTGQVASGIMKGYNPVSLTGFGLSGAIDKRIARIQKTLQKKKSDTLQKRLKELQNLKAKEAAAASKQLESQRRGRRPGTGGSGPPGTGGVKDSGGSTGGYSYDSGGRKGFGYGLKNGGLVSLL